MQIARSAGNQLGNPILFTSANALMTCPQCGWVAFAAERQTRDVEEAVMNHVVLLGDSIFDNASYVPGGPSVIEHLQTALPKGYKATLLAIDGSVTEDVPRQLSRLPADATHLIVSVGGNDALSQSFLVSSGTAESFAEVLTSLGEIQEQFQKVYRNMLLDVRTYGKPVAVCTIYDSIPGLNRAKQAGLCLFNDIILREAFRSSVPVIDLRLICNSELDYSSLSPIEPSVSGGRKIAQAIIKVVTGYSFPRDEIRVFV